MKLEDLKFDPDDKLQRKVYAKRLTSFLVANKDDINVACINAPWGTGKTWFVHMWKNYIIDEFSKIEDGAGIVPVYYNSWENDEYEDAFIPLISEIKNQLFTDEFEKKYKTIVTNLAIASGAILKDAAYNIANKATGGLLDFKVGPKAVKENEDVFNKTVEKYMEHSKAKTDFKINLKDSIKKLNKHVFIFVDELDRCRPTFAIETLERIKHYFDVDGITFIIMLDKEQLSHSVKVLYGNECDTSGYLLRFFDIEYSLPKISKAYYIEQIFDINNNFGSYVQGIDVFFDLSIRDYEKIELWLKAFSIGVDKRFHRLSGNEYQLVIYLMLLKLKFPAEYNVASKMHVINGGKLPFENEIDRYLKSEEEILLIHGFRMACQEDIRRAEYLKNLEKSRNKDYILKLCTKGRIEAIFSALSFLENIK